MRNKPNMPQTILNVAIVLLIVCFFIIRTETGEYLSLSLVASVLVLIFSFSRLIRICEEFQQTEEGRQQYLKYDN